MLSIIAYVIAGIFFLLVGLNQTIFNLTSVRELGWGLCAYIVGLLLSGVGPAFTFARQA